MVASETIDAEACARVLDLSPLCPTWSEARGMLHGLICAGARDPVDAWLAQLLGERSPGDLLVQEGAALLRHTAAALMERLDDPDRGLRAALGDEDAAIAERAAALHDWLRGFLFAFGIQGIDGKRLTAEAREVLRDFTELTRMELETLEDDASTEEALAEVSEFVWVGAMLLYEELAAPREAESL